MNYTYYPLYFLTSINILVEIVLWLISLSRLLGNYTLYQNQRTDGWIDVNALHLNSDDILFYIIQQE